MSEKLDKIIQWMEDFTVDDFKLLNYQSTKYQGKIPVAV